jgi:hypothetical protein
MTKVWREAGHQVTVLAGMVVTIGADGKMDHYNIVGYGAAFCGLLTIWLVGYIHSDTQKT